MGKKSGADPDVASGVRLIGKLRGIIYYMLLMVKQSVGVRSPDRAGAVRKQKIRFVAARHPSKRAPIRGRNDSQIFLGHLAQSPGMVKTIPYRLGYNV
mgnify:CR=1 FL=1